MTPTQKGVSNTKAISAKRKRAGTNKKKQTSTNEKKQTGTDERTTSANEKLTGTNKTSNLLPPFTVMMGVKVPNR